MKTEPWNAGMTSWLDLMTDDLEGATFALLEPNGEM